MSNSPLVSYTQISPNRTSPRKHKIDTITPHCYVGQVTVERMGKGWAKPGNVSANYGIAKDGKIGLYVEEKDRAWTSSNRANDNRAITIEIASDSRHPYAISDAAYNSLIDLCEDICRRNDIPGLKWRADKSLIGQPDKQNITVHRWFKNKACPGQYIYDRLGDVADEVNRRLGVTVDLADPPETEETYSFEDFVRDVQSAIGAKVDGIPGPETLRKSITLSNKKNRTHTVVKAVQKRLAALGYTEVGKADGIAGVKFACAVRKFQKDNDCVVDGVITARAKTWRKLFRME